jgi:hypothetical protein
LRETWRTLRLNAFESVVSSWFSVIGKKLCELCVLYFVSFVLKCFLNQLSVIGFQLSEKPLRTLCLILCALCVKMPFLAPTQACMAEAREQKNKIIRQINQTAMIIKIYYKTTK